MEYAEISLQGAREDNQDRVSIAVAEHAVLLIVVDGMGGHAEGGRAAETTQRVITEAFWHTPQPLFDPLGFLHLTLGRAHEEVVKLGSHLSLELRPRATCAVALVQQGAAWFGHIGDSRIYHVRQGVVRERTRDHSHVEFLLREGVITEDQVQLHPMRNFVECCVGGDPILPEMALGPRRVLEPNDVLMLCTDGLWSGVSDLQIGRGFAVPGEPLRNSLQRLAESAVAANGPTSDNTTLAALRWIGP